MTRGSAVVGTVLAGFDGCRGRVRHLAVAPEARRVAVRAKLPAGGAVMLPWLGASPRTAREVRGRLVDAVLPGSAGEGMLMRGGIVGLLILIADIWAILHIVQSRESTGTKTLWVVLVLVLPVLGVVIWYFAGPRSATG